MEPVWRRKKKKKGFLIKEKEQVKLSHTLTLTLDPIFQSYQLCSLNLKTAGADHSALGFQGLYDKKEINCSGIGVTQLRFPFGFATQEPLTLDKSRKLKVFRATWELTPCSD